MFPDTDHYFGGYKRYIELSKFILEKNKNKQYFNIHVNPPYVEEILNDLIPIIRNFLQYDNNVLVMYPTWKDLNAYIQLMKTFPKFKYITNAYDMWTHEKITNVTQLKFQ